MSRVTYGPEGTQIINVDGKFYLGVDTGDSLYMYEVPKGWTLADLTDMTDIEQNNRDASASFYNDLVTTGDMIEITDAQFKGKVSYEDRIVVVGSGIYPLTKEYDDVDSITAMLSGLDELKTTAPFWSNANYVNTLEDWVMDNGIDNIELYWDSVDHNKAIEEMGYTIAQYNGLTKKAKNRLSWEEDVQNNLASLQTHLTGLGGELSETVLTAIAEQWASGWSEEKSKRTVRKLVDSSYTLGGPVDAKIQAIADGTEIKQTTLGTEKIKSLMDTYLAPNLHSGIKDIASHASKLRNNPNYETKFIKDLKAKNKLEYSMYDEDMEIGFLIDSKINSFEQTTGIKLDQSKDSDYAIIDKMLKLNDFGEEKKLARSRGYSMGSAKVMNDVNNALGRTFGKGIVGAQQFREQF